jgi:hypothetical protein
MSRRSRRSKDPVAQAAKAVAYPFQVKSKLEAFLRPAARVAGFVGIALLVGCAVLWTTPAPKWPRGLSPDRLPVYAMTSLVVASLLGWTFVHDGQVRIKRAIGKTASFPLFVVLPIAFAILGLVGAARLAAVGGPAPSHWLWTLVRWYGPSMVVASLAAFLTWKSRGRTSRGAWFAVLVAPYAALFAYLVFGLHVAGIAEARHATLTALGSWAIALQLATAFFIGGKE